MHSKVRHSLCLEQTADTVPVLSLHLKEINDFVASGYEYKTISAYLSPAISGWAESCVPMCSATSVCFPNPKAWSFSPPLTLSATTPLPGANQLRSGPSCPISSIATRDSLPQEPQWGKFLHRRLVLPNWSFLKNKQNKKQKKP